MTLLLGHPFVCGQCGEGCAALFNCPCHLLVCDWCLKKHHLDHQRSRPPNIGGEVVVGERWMVTR